MSSRPFQTKYTLKEDQEMVRLWNLGMSSEQIACEMHIPSRCAVLGRLYRLKQSKKFKIENRRIGKMERRAFLAPRLCPWSAF